MDLNIWNKETNQAYVGTLLYSLLGILAAILTPFVGLEALAAFSGDSLGDEISISGVILSIVETCIVLGYIVFLLAIKNLRNITDGEDQRAFKRLYLSIVFDIIAAVLGIFHLGILCGILGLVSCILLISAYSTLKSSSTISQISASAISGFGLLFTAEILILVAICIGWIPFIKLIGGILKAIAWVLVLLGWRKVAQPVAIPGEEAPLAKPFFATIKDVFAESFYEAKTAANEAGKKMKIVANEVSVKAKEASNNIKERLREPADSSAGVNGEGNSTEIENNQNN